MSIEILLIGLLVGLANFFNRFVPIWLVHKNSNNKKIKDVRGLAWRWQVLVLVRSAPCLRLQQ